MIQVTSKLDLDGQNPTGQPSPMIARSGREAEFQNALNRYLADYIRQQALITRSDTSRIEARLPLLGRVVDWLGKQLQTRRPGFRAIAPN